jgi:hypothetical protein
MAELFRNHQWVVTDWGLEGLYPSEDDPYLIPADGLLERGGIGRGILYDWPLHIAQKTWADIDAFIEAYLQALEVHKGRYQGEVDPDTLGKSLHAARQPPRRSRYVGIAELWDKGR